MKASDDDQNLEISSSSSSDEEEINSNVDVVASDEYMSNDSEEECAIFVCKDCGKKFKNGISLKAHLAKMHNPRALVNCGLCDSKYRGSFNEHINSQHMSKDGDDCNYFCKKCDFTCSEYETIFLHRHVKNVGNVCKQCGRMYKSKEKYKFHLLVHENDSENKKENKKTFICETCGKKYYYACLLKDHINLHKGIKPHVCKICGCSFSQRATLKQHSATHSSMRQYKCQQCSKAFFRNSDLKKHMTHHVNNEYICE